MLALEDLLTAIQNAHVYEDSKTAVDLVLKSDVRAVATAFAKWRAANNETDAAALQQFITKHLDEAGSDLTPCTPPDWQQQPPNFLPRLAAAAAAGDNASYGTGMNATAAELYDFGLKVHALWKVLCREVSPDVYAHPERHSLLPLPNRTVVPGDRFREVYYWDSYWVIRGLLISKMTDTALGMVSNLMSMLERLGHVPNGARVYYLNRSQPPLLSAMIREVYEALPEDSSSSSSSSSSSRSDLLQRALPLLLTEHHYWTSPPKQVRVLSQDGAAVYNLSRYYADWYQPRPESYREDAALAAEVTSSSTAPTTAAAAARQLYLEIASGAESGWDFSSRWFADNKSLATIRTTKVVPCDLNAWLYQLERNIAWMANITGDAGTSDKFNKAAQQRKQAIDALLWDDEAAMWRDGILTPINTTTTNSSSSSPDADDQLYTLHQNRMMFASNFVPLWTGITKGDDDHDDDHLSHSSRGPRVVEALQVSGLIGPAGISTTLYPTGHQWDAPNGWPPLQHMLIEAASRFGGQLGDQVAADLARTWVGVNLNVYKATGFMHEKYDVSVAGGLVGGGGEYKPQVGFGWTNGVLLDLLNTFF